MTANAQTATAAHGHDEHHVHPPSHYIKIYFALVVLFCISVAGPTLGIRSVTLFTAFGIALVKAYLVCAYFMHLNIQKKFTIYMLVTALAFMGLFFFAVAPDVMKHEGKHWSNEAAKLAVQRGEAAGAEGTEHFKHGGGGEHGGEHAPAEPKGEKPHE